MGKINILDQNLINQIAAGEVIERPNSVVKELVENSIDSGAKNIIIEIDNAGKDRITVIDDGSGMSIEDSEKSIIKHATSKITSTNDLFNILTMGFRGEALASIASISKLEIITKDNTHTGISLKIENSNIIEKQEFPREHGTSIIVRDLFYNTPVRLKYLKDNYLENSHVIKTIQNFCLIHPEINFELIINGKMQIKSPSSDFKNNTISIYTKEIAKNLIAIEGSTQVKEINGEEIKLDDGESYQVISVYGLISKPHINRQNKNEINVYFNKRPVKNFVVDRAIGDAYHNLLFNKSHPICIINIEIEPNLIDVNVHPQKKEIRVKCEKELYDIVYDACRSTLETNNLTPDVQFKKDQTRLDGTKIEDKNYKKFNYEAINEEFNLDNQEQGIKSKYEAKQDLLNIKKDIKERYNPLSDNTQEELAYSTLQEEDSFEYDYKNELKSDFSIGGKKDFVGINDHLFTKLNSDEDYEKEFLKYINTKNVLNKNVAYNPDKEIRVIGQFHRSFILAQDNKGLLIVDQHVAEERYFYEKYMEDYFNKSIQIQELLNPIVMDLTVDEFNFSINNKDSFKELGIELEEFGSQNVKVKTLPIIFNRLQDKNFFFAILENIQKDTIFKINRKKDKHIFDSSSEGDNDSNYNLIDELKEKIITKMACMNSIKAGEELTLSAMQRIIDKWNMTKNKNTCPHGRPIQIRISFSDMWRQFKRDG